MDDELARAIVRFLKAGHCHPSEAARLVGVSPQLVYAWMNRHGARNWARARANRLAALWRKERERGAKLAKRQSPKTGDQSLS